MPIISKEQPIFREMKPSSARIRFHNLEQRKVQFMFSKTLFANDSKKVLPISKQSRCFLQFQYQYAQWFLVCVHRYVG